MPELTITETDVADMATKALDDIAKQPRGHVYASRKGKVAGICRRKYIVIFRRVAGQVRFEFWPWDSGRQGAVKTFPLEGDLALRAGRMLDKL